MHYYVLFILHSTHLNRSNKRKNNRSTIKGETFYITHTMRQTEKKWRWETKPEKARHILKTLIHEHQSAHANNLTSQTIYMERSHKQYLTIQQNMCHICKLQLQVNKLDKRNQTDHNFRKWRFIETPAKNQ